MKKVCWFSFGVILLVVVSGPVEAAKMRKGLTCLSKRFIRKYCTSTDEEIERDEKGFVPHEIRKYDCRNLNVTQIIDKPCDKKCRDPVTKKKKPGKLYKVERICYYREYENRDGKIEKIKLTAGCRCVKRRQKS
ncbi:uncharacterized protein LOC120337841 [Styela clava]